MDKSLTLYSHLATCLGQGLIDWPADALRLALVDSGYAFSADHTVWADASAHEITGAGYPAGGAVVSGASITRSGAVTSFDAADVPFSGLTATFRRGIVYKLGTAGGLVNPLIAAILFDDTPADVTAVGGFPVVWSPAGVFKISEG